MNEVKPKYQTFCYKSDANGKLTSRKPERDKEVRRLAQLFLEMECEPKDILESIDPNVEIDESNETHGFSITPEEVIELMKFMILQNQTKEKISDQKRRRDAGTFTKLSEVPYRDWLAGIIYAQAMGQLSFKNAIKHTDDLIAELYPIEGEL